MLQGKTPSISRLCSRLLNLKKLSDQQFNLLYKSAKLTLQQEKRSWMGWKCELQYLPSSCGSSWQNTANDVLRPMEILLENPAPAMEPKSVRYHWKKSQRTTSMCYFENYQVFLEGREIALQGHMHCLVSKSWPSGLQVRVITWWLEALWLESETLNSK